ncbi:Aluminum-activated malate transporter 2 [Striga hermonthica]|uniref:Aluminum-activated malate transporter 2 n=1 Tax=Striga hermonthica TaxID=68872 RepID=A0A9N7N772_STRHE|nr:Aluminum-activated malate transporter 2 [Striga hermonthica]
MWRRFLSCVKGTNGRKAIHSMKVGLALVIVSLLYIVNPMFEEVGQNGMWAVMTVVVMFEFYAGATLGKGINRIIGTLTGGILGCLAAILGDEIGGIGKDIIIGSAVFILGAGVTYCRLVPRLKRRYDYGFMIFIMSFSLVAISGIRVDKVAEVGRDRIATIGIGFAVCIFVSLVVCPIWASDELHLSTAHKFDKLSTSIQGGCLDEYFKIASEKENQGAIGGDYYIQACTAVLNSKSNDELLANHAKWEPWHGKFGLSHPWAKYLEVGDHLSELAATIFALQICLQSSKQPSPMQRQILKEPCETFMLTTQWILKELGESIEKMELCKTKSLINPKLQSAKLQLGPPFSTCYKAQISENDENLAITTFNFLLVEIVEKVEILAKKVEELGEAANFRVKKIDV